MLSSSSISLAAGVSGKSVDSGDGLLDALPTADIRLITIDVYSLLRGMVE